MTPPGSSEYDDEGGNALHADTVKLACMIFRRHFRGDAPSGLTRALRNFRGDASGIDGHIDYLTTPL